MLLTDRSCRGEFAVGLRVVTERELLRDSKGLGAVPFRGVLPCGLLDVLSVIDRPTAYQRVHTYRGPGEQKGPRPSTAARALDSKKWLCR